MIGIFKQKSPANILLLLVFGLLIKLPMFMHPHIVGWKEEDGVLFKAIVKFIQPTGRSYPVVFPVIAFIVLFLQAILLNRIINNQRMMNRPTYFGGMAYMLVTSLLPEWNYFSAPLIINLILLFLLSALFRIYNQENAKGTIFNMGVALGLASFIFFPSVAFFIWILLALMVMRPFRLNEWLLCIVGITTPFYFYAVYLFITNQWSWQHLWPHFSVSLPSVKQSAWRAGSVFFLLVPFLMGGFYVQDGLRKMLIQVRKGWSLLLLYLLVAFFVPFINNSNNFENWVMMAVPFASFHAFTYLYSPLRIFPLLLFWFTVAFILSYQYAGPGW